MTLSVHILQTGWLPVSGDRNELEIRFEVVRPTESKHGPQQHMSARMVVSISRTLQAIWQLNGRALESVLVAYAKQHIADKLLDCSLLQDERLELSTYNSPSSSPFDPALEHFYVPTGFELEVPQRPAEPHADINQLGARIAELRDAINAVFGEKFEARLLTLPQERALSDLSRSCTTKEDFAYRVSALCILATSLDTSSLPKAGSGPLDALGAFLRPRVGEDLANHIMGPLAEFNHLRRIYPVHTDRASGVVSAFQYFGIDYPVADHQQAWDRLRKRYVEVLEHLLLAVQKLQKADGCGEELGHANSAGRR